MATFDLNVSSPIGTFRVENKGQTNPPRDRTLTREQTERLYRILDQPAREPSPATKEAAAKFGRIVGNRIASSRFG